MKTSLGEENEKALLSELAPIIKKWATKMKTDSDSIESSVAYLWTTSHSEARQEWRDYLSANDLGPFGGR